MSTLVIDQRGATLGYQTGALVIRVSDSAPKTVPLRMLERVVIAASVTLTSGVLTRLGEHDIGLTVLPSRGSHGTRFLHAFSHGDAARRVGQYQLTLDEDRSLAWAKRFVVYRLRAARRLMRHASDQRADRRRGLVRAIESLDIAIDNARHAECLSSLRGIEGAGTAAHFKAFADLFPDALGFTGRNRRPPRDPANASLSLGYTLAHGEAVRALVSAGLDPMLGFLHTPEHGRESLACDFVEIARASIETLVWRLFAEQVLRPDAFSEHEGGGFLRKAARSVFFSAYARHASWHRRAYRRYATALARDCRDIQPAGDAP